MRRAFAFLLLLCLPPAFSLAEVPVRTEQSIWSIVAYNGNDYAATFAPTSSDTIYLLAGVDNFLSIRSTLVYWWPITGEWKTDTDSLNIQFPGTLELRDAGGKTKTLETQVYTYYNVRGEYEQNWKVATGDAALSELQKYAVLYESYYKATEDFQRATQTYNEEIQALGTRAAELKSEGKDFSALLTRMRNLPRPVAPQQPRDYAVPPTDLQQGFIVNIPAGSYSIRLINPDGTVLEGSEKSLLVHERRRTGGIGFEVIPSDKWTRPTESRTPSSVLYVSGSADLYLRPFFEDEFNDLEYEKTVNNTAKGNSSIVKWVRIQQVPRAKIEVTGEESAVLAEEPFTVQQTQGSSLGYTIIPYDPQGAGKDKDPDLIAFRLPVGKGPRLLRVRALDAAGAPLGGERQIRIIGPSPFPLLTLALALSPLLVMVIVLLARARGHAAGEKITD
jgi:hypothetical protein